MKDDKIFIAAHGGMVGSAILDVFLNKSYFNIENGDTSVEVDPRYFSPTEVDLLAGDATQARNKLGWFPKYTFDELVEEMVLLDQNKIKAIRKNDENYSGSPN